MPITATFNADFSKFFVAVELAQTKLVSFEGDAKKVANSLSAMEKSISGVAIVQAATIAAEAVDRLGGVSKLTYDELQRLGRTAQEAVDKLKALGQDIPSKMQNLADQARGAAEQTQRLGDATKTAADNTSGWGTAVNTLVGTFGALTLQRVIDEVIQLGVETFNAADKLQQFRDRTDISVETLQRLQKVGKDTGVSLDTMASAMQTLQKNIGVGDASTEAALARLGLSLADIKKLEAEDTLFAVAKGLKEMEDPADQAATGMELLGGSFKEMKPAINKGFGEMTISAEQWSTSTVKAIADTKSGAVGFVDYIKGGFGQVVADVLTQSTEGFRRMKDEVDKLVDKTLKAADKNPWGQIVPPGLPKDLDAIAAGLEKSADASIRFHEAQQHLAEIGPTWQKTLEDINPWILADIDATVKAGGALEDLIAFYGIAEEKGKALTLMIKDMAEKQKDYAEMLKKVADLEKDTRGQQEQGLLGLSKMQQETSQKRMEAESRASDNITKLYAEEHDYILKSTLSATDYQIAKVNEAAAAKIKALEGTSQQVAIQTEKILAAAKRESDGIIAAATAALDVVAKKGMDTLALLDLTRRQIDAKMAVDVVGNAETAGYGRSGMQAPIYVAPPIFARAAGGPVTSGQPYMVGERGPELFVPSTSGGIVPNGRAGVVQNITIHVNGTAQDVARQVSDEIMRAAMRGQQFGAS